MFKLLHEAEKNNFKVTDKKNVFMALSESQHIDLQDLHESMHLLLTKAINLLSRLDKNDYTAADEISKLPFYALATTSVAGEHIGELEEFRKDVGDKRPLADFIADKQIVAAPSTPDNSGSPSSTNSILANFASTYAKNATTQLQDAFERSKRDPIVRAALLKRLRMDMQRVDTIYSKAVGNKQQLPQQGIQPQVKQRTA